MIKRLATIIFLAGITLIGSPAFAVDTLSPFSNPSMELGQALTNGRYTFIQQNDGNLVLYRDSTPLWATYKNGFRSVIQTDGNFVQYDAAGNAVWASNTTANDASNIRLELLSNGQVQVTNAPPSLFTWTKIIIPADTSVPPTTPSGPCGNGSNYNIYPVCIPTGGGRGMNGTILACTQSEAATKASRNGWSFGYCTF